MQAVGAHRQCLALRAALVMAILAQHHRQLLRRRPVGRVGRGRALRAGHGRLAGAPSSRALLGCSFLLGSSGGEMGEGEDRAQVRMRRGSWTQRRGAGSLAGIGGTVLAGSAGSEQLSAPSRRQ